LITEYFTVDVHMDIRVPVGDSGLVHRHRRKKGTVFGCVLMTALAGADILLSLVLGGPRADKPEGMTAHDDRFAARSMCSPVIKKPATPSVNVVDIGDMTEVYLAAAPGRYDGIELTAEDLDLVAEIVAIEARGEPFEGQVAVAAVIFNRCLTEGFPDTVREVIFDRRYGVQFTSTAYLGQVKVTDKQYAAVDQALHGDPIVPAGVVYFSVAGENDNEWGRIGNHVFCYGY
jgi:hypothetical protein